MNKYNIVDRYGTQNISTFVLEMTQQCNFRCKYCCFSGSYNVFRTHNPTNMSPLVINNAIEFIKKHSSNENIIDVGFYGGESLLQLESIKEIIKQLSLFFKNRITYNISTNGYILNKEIIDWVCSVPNLRLSVSLDGSRDIHDNSRITASGKPTYDVIISNLIDFKKRYENEYNNRIQILLTYKSLSELELMNENYSVLKQISGNNEIFISHIIPNFKENNTYFDSYQIKKEFFSKAYMFWKNKEDNLYTIAFKKLLKSVDSNEKSSQNAFITLHTCLDDLYSSFINVKGDIFLCEKCVDSMSIGNISNGFDIDKMQKLSKLYALRKNYICKDCPATQHCKRCVAYLRDKSSSWKINCNEIKENIELALKFKKMIDIENHIIY